MKKLVILLAGLGFLSACSEHKSPNRSLESAYSCGINGGGSVAVLKGRNDQVSVAFLNEKGEVAKLDVQNDVNGKQIDLVFIPGTCKATALQGEDAGLSISCGPVRFAGINVPEIGQVGENSAVQVNEQNTAKILEVTVSGEGKLQSREVSDRYTTAGSFVVKARYLSDSGVVTGEKESFLGADVKPQVLTNCEKADRSKVSRLINNARSKKTAKN